MKNAIGSRWIFSIVSAFFLTVFITMSRGDILQNGSMSEGDEKPTSWSLYKGSGTLVLTKDKEVYKQGPASLCLSSGDSPAVGNAYQSFPFKGGRITVSGYVKVDGALDESLVAVQTFEGDSFVPSGWFTVYNATKATDWQEFSTTVTIPPTVSRCTVTVTLKGTGKVWLDEVTLKTAE